MCTIKDIPHDVVVSNILEKYTDLDDILNFCNTCKQYYGLLKYIDFYNIKFNYEQYKSFEYKYKIKNLNLYFTKVSDITPLKELKLLKELNLANTNVTDITPLKELKSLERLILMCTKVSDITPLKELKSLQDLYLANTKVSDITPLKELKSLKVNL